MPYEQAKVKDNRWSTLSKRDAYTATLTQLLSCRKSYEHEFEHLCETASEIMSKKEFVMQNLVMFSSLRSVPCYTNGHHSGRNMMKYFELRKISDIELKFLTIKPIHQKQLPVSVL